LIPSLLHRSEDPAYVNLSKKASKKVQIRNEELLNSESTKSIWVRIKGKRGVVPHLASYEQAQQSRQSGLESLDLIVFWFGSFLFLHPG